MNEVKTLHYIGETAVDLSTYERATTASGNRSLDCGDDVARGLRGLPLEKIYKIAARALKKSGKEEGKLSEIREELESKYGGLNAGMQRMTLGRRIRAALRAAPELGSVEELMPRRRASIGDH